MCVLCDCHELCDYFDLRVCVLWVTRGYACWGCGVGLYGVWWYDFPDVCVMCGCAVCGSGCVTGLTVCLCAVWGSTGCVTLLAFVRCAVHDSLVVDSV